MQRALFFVKPHASTAIKNTKTLCQHLQAQGIPCFLCESADVQKQLPHLPALAAEQVQAGDVAFAMGGDGTYLHAAYHLYNKPVPLLGVNAGRLGFLAEFDTAESAMNSLTTNDLAQVHITHRPYFLANIQRRDTSNTGPEPFLNDAVLQRATATKMVQFSVFVNKSLMTQTRADGLVVATPTGSTAYNLSAGGPIVHPSLQVLILAPICPHTLSFRPVVVPPQPIALHIESDNTLLSLDGRAGTPLMQGDVVEITPAAVTLQQIDNNAQSFFALLRHKLGWNF